MSWWSRRWRTAWTREFHRPTGATISEQYAPSTTHLHCTGNFGVLIQDGLVYASDPRAGTIRIFDLDAMGTSEVLVTNHEGPDGMAWSPIRVNVVTESASQ